MIKQEFLEKLESRLKGLPKSDMEERISFYSEMIDDRVEEGLSEEDAVMGIGSVDSIASQIISETPFVKIVKEKMKTKRNLKAREIILLAIGSPIWVSLLICVLAVIFSIYVSIWAVVISLWAVLGSFVGSSIGGILTGAILACMGNGAMGFAMIGAGITLAGLSILLFYGCRSWTKWTLGMGKALALGVKKSFVNKEEA